MTILSGHFIHPAGIFYAAFFKAPSVLQAPPVLTAPPALAMR
jgi:hypothetical protein